MKQEDEILDSPDDREDEFVSIIPESIAFKYTMLRIVFSLICGVGLVFSILLFLLDYRYESFMGSVVSFFGGVVAVITIGILIVMAPLMSSNFYKLDQIQKMRKYMSFERRLLWFWLIILASGLFGLSAPALFA